jgi:hypothetical protein
LAGNGAILVRERAIASRIQKALEHVYRIDRTADIDDFLECAADGQREALIVREDDAGDVRMSVQLPRLEDEVELDTLCQIIEGVSHFVYVVERVRAGRAATQLELELQAEVDKWVVLGASRRAFDADQSADLRGRLYERVSFVHGETTELGERYRLANDAAHRFVRHLERCYVGSARLREMYEELRRFFNVGQEEKLRFGRAA